MLDGSDLSWQLFDWRSLVDVVAWILIITFIYFWGHVKRYSFYGLFFVLLFIQLGNLGHIFLAIRNEPVEIDRRSERVSFADAFEFSTNSNIIIMILDAYQTDVFYELLQKNPTLKENLEGFTYYPNALGGYPFTALSVPLILTGQYYLNQAPRHVFLQEVYRKHSVINSLNNMGYHIGIHAYYDEPTPLYQAVSSGLTLTHNRVPGIFEIEANKKEIVQLFSMALFRGMPHSARKVVHEKLLMDTAQKQDRDHFISDLKTHAVVSWNDPVFRLYHLQGLHIPWVLDEKLLSRDRESALLIGEKVNDLIINLKQELTRINVYNDSSILIVADHGMGGFPFSYGDITCDRLSEDDIKVDNFAKKDKALPLFLFKPAEAKGPLQVSMAPVSLLDVAPTILSAAGVEEHSAYEGKSVLVETAEDSRIRRYYSYDFHADRQGGYWQPLHEYFVSGFSWCDASWRRTGNIFAKTGQISDEHQQ